MKNDLQSIAVAFSNWYHLNKDKFPLTHLGKEARGLASTIEDQLHLLLDDIIELEDGEVK